MYSPPPPSVSTTALKVLDKYRVERSYLACTRIDEYSLAGALLSRRWRAPDRLGKPAPWEYEVGEAPAAAAAAGAGEQGLVTVNAANPTFVPLDSAATFLFKVRNCPWALENYVVAVDEEKDEIVIRSKNKKYFKRFRIPALARLGIKHDEQALDLTYVASESSLVVAYTKPVEVLKHEEEERKEWKLKLAKGAGESGESCKQS